MEFKKQIFGYRPEDVYTKLEKMNEEHTELVNKLKADMALVNEEIDNIEKQKKALEQEIENNARDRLLKILYDKYMNAVKKVYQVNKTITTNIEDEKFILNGLKERQEKISKSMEEYMDNLKSIIDSH